MAVRSCWCVGSLHGSQRQLDKYIAPLFAVGCGPHEHQLVDRHTYAHTLSDKYDSWARLLSDELGKVVGHRTAVMRHQNPVLTSSQGENLAVGDSSQIGLMSRPEINARFPSQYACDDVRIEVGISLEADDHRRT